MEKEKKENFIVSLTQSIYGLTILVGKILNLT